MGTWLFHIGLASAGLAVTALVAALMLRVWRGQPVASYRLAVLVLGAALALPLAQLAIEAGEVSTLELAGRTWSRWTSATAATVEAPTPNGALPRLAEPLTTPAAPTPLGTTESAAELPPFLQVLLATSHDLRDTRESEASGGLARATPWLLALYLVGAAWAAARLAVRLARTRRLLHEARPVEDAATLALWDRVASDSRLCGRVRLLRSERLRAPACFGLLSPAVVLPARDRMSDRPDVQRCVLLHELLHLERRDSWVLLLQEVFRCAFWFHPASIWLVRRLDALREISCDDLVVRRSGGPRRYATALVEYAAALGDRPRAATGDPAMLAWSSSRPQLKRRIEMLLSKKSSGRAGWIPVAAGLFMVSWSCQLALAGTTPESEDETAPEPLPSAIASAPAAAPPAAPLPAMSPRGSAPTTTPTPPAAPLPAALARPGEVTLGLRLREVHGLLLVSDVVDGSPAARAGVRAGDAILAIEGHRAADMTALQASRERLGAGREVVLTVLRNGQAQTLELTSGRLPPSQTQAVDKWLARDAYEEALDYYRQVDPNAQELGSRDIYEAGRKYYAEVDPEQFREHMDQAIAQYRKAAGSNAQDSRYAELLAKVQADPDRYYKAGQSYFRQHTADDFAQALDESRAQLADTQDGQAALKYQLQSAQKLIQQQADQIAELRKAIEDLQRAQRKTSRGGNAF